MLKKRNICDLFTGSFIYIFSAFMDTAFGTFPLLWIQCFLLHTPNCKRFLFISAKNSSGYS